MEGFSLILAALIMFLVYLVDRRKKSKTSKRVDSFSECSEWSFSDISCSSDSGVVNITITSRQ